MVLNLHSYLHLPNLPHMRSLPKKVLQFVTIVEFGKCVDFGEYLQNQLASPASNGKNWKKIGFW